jgi:hypothetical protein
MTPTSAFSPPMPTATRRHAVTLKRTSTIFGALFSTGWRGIWGSKMPEFNAFYRSIAQLEGGSELLPTHEKYRPIAERASVSIALASLRLHGSASRSGKVFGTTEASKCIDDLVEKPLKHLSVFTA